MSNGERKIRVLHPIDSLDLGGAQTAIIAGYRRMIGAISKPTCFHAWYATKPIDHRARELSRWSSFRRDDGFRSIFPFVLVLAVGTL